MIFDADDFGCNHEISDQCQSHDCRDVLIKLHEINPNFKATLFAIPGEMTYELLRWCRINKEWIELAVHGFYHESNYECDNMSYNECKFLMNMFKRNGTLDGFVKGFKAPGWQISDGVMYWLMYNGYWIADQSYNDNRRPEGLKAYINNDGKFTVNGVDQNGQHFHTWNCVGNGVYEKFDYLKDIVTKEQDWKFVSEAFL